MRDYSKIPPIPKSMWTNPLHFIAFGFGSGAMPVAPGTFGTLVGIPFYLAMQSLPPLHYFLITVAAILISIWICHKVSRDIGVHDHPGMSLDEIIGFLVTMFLAPHGWLWIGLGFLLFRLFDIWKPWPIGYIDDKVSGGLGVILDDVIAGIVSCIILQFIARVLV